MATLWARLEFYKIWKWEENDLQTCIQWNGRWKYWHLKIESDIMEKSIVILLTRVILSIEYLKRDTVWIVKCYFHQNWFFLSLFIEVNCYWCTTSCNDVSKILTFKKMWALGPIIGKVKCMCFLRVQDNFIYCCGLERLHFRKSI